MLRQTFSVLALLRFGVGQSQLQGHPMPCRLSSVSSSGVCVSFLMSPAIRWFFERLLFDPEGGGLIPFPSCSVDLRCGHIFL